MDLNVSKLTEFVNLVVFHFSSLGTWFPLWYELKVSFSYFNLGILLPSIPREQYTPLFILSRLPLWDGHWCLCAHIYVFCWVGLYLLLFTVTRLLFVMMTALAFLVWLTSKVTRFLSPFLHVILWKENLQRIFFNMLQDKLRMHIPSYSYFCPIFSFLCTSYFTLILQIDNKSRY